MKLADIFDLWEVDSQVDRRVIDDEALKISSLHKKYHEIFTNERLMLRKYEMELKVLKLEKFEFLTDGPTKETQEKGWKLPPKGKIIRSDAQQYVDADKEVINLTLKIGLQHEKITLLESILKTIHQRSFNLRAAIDFIKWTNGA